MSPSVARLPSAGYDTYVSNRFGYTSFPTDDSTLSQ